LKSFGFDSVPDITQLLESIRSQVGVEGFVIRFNDGRLYKIKTKWYFTVHRSTQFLKFYGERHIWEAILKDTYDDVKAFLPSQFREAIDNFSRDLLAALHENAAKLIAEIREIRKTCSQTDFGKLVIAKCHDGIKRKIYRVLNDKMEEKSEKGTIPDDKIELKVPDVVQILAEEAMKHLGSKKAMRALHSITNDITYETYRPKSQTKENPLPEGVSLGD